jgi:hypothetical protein
MVDKQEQTAELGGGVAAPAPNGHPSPQWLDDESCRVQSAPR